MEPGNEGIDNEGGAAHAAYQQEKELSIIREDFQAAFRDRGIDEAQDAERGELDDPAYDLRHDIGQVADHPDGVLRSQQFQAQADDDGPEQDTDIVRLCQRLHGVHHHVGKERQEHVGKTAGCGAFGFRPLQPDGDREQETGHHGQDGRAERRHQIQRDDSPEPGTQATFRLGDGRCHEQGHQHRGDGFEGAHEHLAQDPDTCPFRAQEPEYGTNHQADDNPQHQRGIGPFLQNRRKLAHRLQGTKKGRHWQEITIFVETTLLI